MATGEQPSPLKSKKISSSSSRTRNDSDTQWLLLPNNLELGARAKPSKKQRNKEKHKQFQKENLSSSEVVEGLPCKARSSYQDFPRVKSNTASWLKDQFVNEEISKQGAYDSDGVFSDSDFPQPLQQNVHFTAKHMYADLDHQENPSSSRRSMDSDNNKSVKDELKKRENAMVCQILTNIQDFITEAESSWQKLDLSDEVVIKDALVKLKNAVKDVDGGRENKLLHNVAAENGFANGISPCSSISRASNSKENIARERDSCGNAAMCNDDEREKCNHHHQAKISDERTESLSSDDCAIAEVGERVAAVEWERRKLKNKLVELKEEKKIKDELLRELCYLKDCANTASEETQHPKTKDKRKKKLGKLQSPSQHLKMAKGVSTDDNQNMSLDSNAPVPQPSASRQPRSSTSLKRDNVRKEENSSFPARRHYEAEGRANEDPDIPTAPAPAASPALDNPEMQDKIKKLKVAQQHVKVIKDIVVSILENRKSGALLPIEQLRLLTPLQNVEQFISDEESDEESEVEREFSLPLHLSSSEATATNVKEVCCEGLKPSLLDMDNHRVAVLDDEESDNLEKSVGRKEDITKLQSQFQQLMQIFPQSDRKNDDPVRSSGEGAYTQKKNPSRNVASENMQKIHMRAVPHQDNLQLTRQNIMTIESQNQNSNSSNLHNRDCNSVKKDNINNLSGKMGKLSIQNSMNSSYPDVLLASSNNMDAMSTLSYDLNQNHSLPNEVERKTIFDILKRGKKKLKQYDRNQDSKICCNSSIDSEPLEGSNSALGLDSTTLAAWGGSSTQENFEDENEEPVESLEEQDVEDESISLFNKRSFVEPRSSQLSGQFSNMQQYNESVKNIREKRLRNFSQSAYTRNPNQSTVHKGYPQHQTQPLKTSQQPVSSSNTSPGLQRELREMPSYNADTPEQCNQHTSGKFVQQLKNHIDQLNALCQNHIYQDRATSTVNMHSGSQGYSHIPNACVPLQSAPDITLPCNQQLLLNLSQCYHALYMQQLEIQHLQRCMWHNMESENSHLSNNQSTHHNNHDDSNFRPYSIPSWSNPFHPSSNFSSDQTPPVSSSTYFHMPMKPYAGHTSNSYAGNQPAHAVIHPTSQNNVTSQETLNNQVPPRTRANNFWDNFRSYSRQNLLSTSNNAKRNENIGSVVAPQVRQVFPLISNDSPNRSADVSSACCSTSSFTDYTRQSSIPDVQEVVNFSKKTKSNTPSVSGCSSLQKNDVPTNVNQCTFRNLRSNRCHRPRSENSPMPSGSNLSSNNLILPQPQDKAGGSHTTSQNSFSQSAPEALSNATSEISRVLSGEHKSDFLIGLFHEAQALKSDVLRQKALKVIRDLAKSERHDSEDSSQVKVHNDQPFPISKVESGSSTVLHQPSSKPILETVTPSPELTDSEKVLYQLPSDTVLGNFQNLPTAAILPVSKQCISRASSTGAVRKKPKVPSSNFSETAVNGLTHYESGASNGDGFDTQTAIPPKKLEAVEDIPGFVAEKVVADLVSMLPSLKRRLLRDGCTQTFWTFINDCLIDSLRTNLFVCNINLSRKALIHLRQTVYLFLSLFSGISLSDFDSEFLKYVEEFIYENITCFLASGHFAPVPTSLDEENCPMEIEDKMQELCVKLPGKSVQSANSKMSFKRHDDPPEQPVLKIPPKSTEDFAEPNVVKMTPMSSEKSINFTSQCGTVTQIGLQNFPVYGNFMPETVETSHAASEPEIQQGLISPDLELGNISPEPFVDHVSPEPEIEHFEIRCDCNPEAEIEPEVEIGTEADLAEADQSPGQQGTLGDGMPMPENWSLDHDVILLHRNANGIALEVSNGDDNRAIDAIEGASGGQSTDGCLDQDAILDDIPTKLDPSEEELPQQLQDVPVQYPVDDIAAHSDFVSENNGEGGYMQN